MLAFLALAGCYRPASEKACTVMCVDDSTCPPEQVCGGDHVCRGPTDNDCTAAQPLDAVVPDARDFTLVGYWPFEEGTGDATADASGNQDPGTLAGSATWATGRVGTFSVALGGGSDAVTVMRSTVLADLGPLTVAAWIRPVNFNAVNGGAQRIVVKEPSYAAASDLGRWIFVLDSNIPGGLEFIKTFSMQALDVETQLTLTAGRWQHVAVTWDGTTAITGVKFYLDGQPVLIQNAVTGTGLAGTDAVYDVTIGNEPGATRAFTGDIDDVRIYNRVLSSTEIAALATQ